MTQQLSLTLSLCSVLCCPIAEQKLPLLNLYLNQKYNSQQSHKMSSNSSSGFKGASAATAICACIVVNTHGHSMIKCSCKRVIKSR